MANLSHHNVTRAFQTLQGSAQLGSYNKGIAGVEFTNTYLWRPSNPIAPLVFTGGISAGASSATLNASWTPPTGLYQITLSTGQVMTALLSNGATTCTFWNVPNNGGIMTAATVIAATTANATVAGVPPVLTSATGYATSQSVGLGANFVLNGAAPYVGAITVNGVTYAVAGIPDVPRNVVAAWTTASNLIVTGLDLYGQLQTELLSTPGGSTGKKAFAVIISINSSASITAATAGYGSVLGLPFRVDSGGFQGAVLNDAVDAGTFVKGDMTYPPTNATGDVRGTYTTSGALNGAKQLTVDMKVSDTTTQIGAFGYTPA